MKAEGGAARSSTSIVRCRKTLAMETKSPRKAQNTEMQANDAKM